MATATYTPIATTTLGSAATGITFSSIPSTYTDLRIVFTYKTQNSNNQFMQLNSDTATNYSATYLSGNGTSASSLNATSTTSIRLDYGISGTNPTTSDVTFVDINIFNYAGSTFKTVLTQTSADFNGTGITTSIVGMWRSTTAVSTVYLYSGGATNLLTGTTATLYGILKA